ncbi:MAG: LysR substrate-binding domain-containing protein [Candidatus Protistobacter heckmanni]|nr:LysR substrate-binding domain-containing protein [Candidatus Protistobacter heckmanni]
MLRISLDAIDRRGTFSAAGEELHRVPSTISYTISKLEQDLGVQVFDRAGPKVSLTDAGQELLREGRYLLKAASDLEHRVKRVASGLETEITLSLDYILTPIRLKDDIEAFYAASGRTHLRITQEVLTGSWESLLDCRADLIMATVEGPSGGGYNYEQIGSTQFIFTLAPDHPLAKAKEPLSKANLQAHHTVSVADTARKLPTRTVGLLFGQDTLTVPDMRNKYEFQLAGLGLGHLPERWARQAIADGRLLIKRTEEIDGEVPFYLGWSSGENGATLRWWRERLRAPGMLDKLMISPLD